MSAKIKPHSGGSGKPGPQSENRPGSGSHKRSNSCSSRDSRHMHSSNSMTKLFNADISQFLSDYLIDEIFPQQVADVSPSFEQFENFLLEGSTDMAREFAKELIDNEPDPKEKGKIARTAAETAKKLFEVNLAKELYEIACKVDSKTSSTWIDRAKLLDELGDYVHAEEVLMEGIKPVTNSENIVRKLLKSFERTGNYKKARNFLAKHAFKNGELDESIVYEGTLFEMRVGNFDNAFSLLLFLKKKYGWRPNIYSDLAVYFTRSGLLPHYFSLIEEGSAANSRNAIACHIILRYQTNPLRSAEIYRELKSKWTTEFADKMVISVCERLAEGELIHEMREIFAEAFAMGDYKQRFKLLTPIAILELIYGDPEMAPQLLNLCLKLAPYRSRPSIYILLAKVFELNESYSTAIDLFRKAVNEFSAEWKVFLEFGHFYLHRGDVKSAIEIVSEGLKIHNGSGRLWAFRVQLEAYNSVESQIEHLKRAITTVPKSGEVWCEAARIVLNPLSQYFNVENAKIYLEFAFRFTPQHGDTLVEMLRVELLEKGPTAKLESIKHRFISSESNYGQLYLFIKSLEERSMDKVFDDAVRMVKADLRENRKYYSRALARSSFVVGSVMEEKERLESDVKDTDPFEFAFGLRYFGQCMLNPDECKSRDQKLSVILGTAAIIQ